jgi:hypothetical protein
VHEHSTWHDQRPPARSRDQGQATVVLQAPMVTPPQDVTLQGFWLQSPSTRHEVGLDPQLVDNAVPFAFQQQALSVEGS